VADVVTLSRNFSLFLHYLILLVNIDVKFECQDFKYIEQKTSTPLLKKKYNVKMSPTKPNSSSYNYKSENSFDNKHAVWHSSGGSSSDYKRQFATDGRIYLIIRMV